MYEIAFEKFNISHSFFSSIYLFETTLDRRSVYGFYGIPIAQNDFADYCTGAVSFSSLYLY